MKAYRPFILSQWYGGPMSQGLAWPSLQRKFKSLKNWTTKPIRCRSSRFGFGPASAPSIPFRWGRLASARADSVSVWALRFRSSRLGLDQANSFSVAPIRVPPRRFAFGRANSAPAQPRRPHAKRAARRLPSSYKKKRRADPRNASHSGNIVSRDMSSLVDERNERAHEM